ncbi:DUF559 domain-containing protein [Bifidobacterium mongoliense]|uniref:DUF559 domain-containing protein n=1 Tax=Bifidobacterium mongoliense TaxID=518643 RepID=UPI0030EC9EEF
MFEIRQQPSEQHIMRCKAWSVQSEYVQRCREAKRMVRFEPVFALDMALGLMGISIEIDPRMHIVMSDRDQYRILPAPIVCHTWNQLHRDDAVIKVFDMACTSPAATFAHMARRYDLESLTMLADVMACRDPVLQRSTRLQLGRFVREGRRLTNRRLCMRALRLSLPGTDSPYESKLRLAILRRGLPMPVINYSLMVDGRVRVLDMAYPEFRIGMEYHGMHHTAQYVDDCERLNALTAGEWKVFPVWGAMLSSESAMDRYVRNVRSALLAAGGSSVVEEPRDLWRLADGRRHRKKR